MKLYNQRPVLTSQIDDSKLQKLLPSVIQVHLDQVFQLWSATLKRMRDSKPQHKSIKGTRNATNRDIHINEASKQTFANNLLKILCKYTQGMLS